MAGGQEEEVYKKFTEASSLTNNMGSMASDTHTTDNFLFS